MTRISTAQVSQQAVDLITSRQAEMARLQTQIATGKRLTTPADDPHAAASTVHQKSEIARLDIERRMVDFAKLKLAQSEGAIGEGVDIYQRARELLLAANNDTYSDGDRASIATELRGLRSDLFSVANRSDGLGAYVFGGNGSRTAPFTEGAGGVAYVADPGVQLTGQERRYATTMDGSGLFATTDKTGASESIFTSLDRTIAMLERTDPVSGDLHAEIESMIDRFDVGLETFNAARGTVGEQLNSVDRRLEQISSGNLVATERLADLTDIDLAEAISALTTRRTELDAAMQTYAQISGLSLFNYIR